MEYKRYIVFERRIPIGEYWEANAGDNGALRGGSDGTVPAVSITTQDLSVSQAIASMNSHDSS